MAAYSEIKEQLLRQVGGSQPSAIKGIPLDGRPSKDWLAIQPCICVKEPCPCDKLDDLIVWLPTSARTAKTHERIDSDEVASYRVEPDEQVLVEIHVPMTVAQLRKLKEWSQRQSAPSAPSIAKKGKPVGTAGAAVAAFEVGYKLGEKLDEGLGLSDKISDWAAENIPWPW